ncbi:adenosylcobinamide amidohydrolase [Halobiforma nitratireducens]|uniref:Adenosylcobinamide amidohydrolase n=1 Tax=Halobiforma nitratireducens JCM 10879 TaxID=1227454 RepID=M0LU83_9EURY|nr:adenosylcobinamide amidohydrolase [Halobiforma nitratireducens]EMA35660.1 adenosylcobinamide amidohydrolase [Halobiforma nitratireducens JCM 10879]
MTEDDSTVADVEYDAFQRDGVLRIARPGTEWLSTGWNGGRTRTDRAYNVSVPEEWGATDLECYVGDRLERAGFDAADADRAPVLLTGVEMADARGARCGPVVAYATAGVSNPAALPVGSALESAPDPRGESLPAPARPEGRESEPEPGTVNVVVATTRTLAPGALANLVAVAAEAKAATLLETVGFPGTTTDAVVVGHDPGGDPPVAFSGSATEVGAATRACVREAVSASLTAHYADRDETAPATVEDATYGVTTDSRASVFRPTVAEPDDASENADGAATRWDGE